MRDSGTNKTPSRGQILVLTSVFLALLLFLSGALIQYFANTSATTARAQRDLEALALAEAGVDRAIWCFNHTGTCGVGYTGETASLGSGEYVVSVTSLSGSTKQVDAVGYIPSQANPRSRRHVRMTSTIDATSISFNYGVQVGEGGLDMENNAKINGNLYSNGSIDGDNGATINGAVSVATGMSLDRSWETQDADFTFGQSSPIIDAAVSFIPSKSGPLSQISVFLKKVGSPADIGVKIVSDASGSPSKTVLASSTLPASSVGTSAYSWVNIAFPAPATLTQGTTYWIVLDAAQSNTKYWKWGLDSASGNAQSASKSVADWNAASPAWSAVAGDLDFRTSMGGLATSITNLTVPFTSGSAVRANTITSSTISVPVFCHSMAASTISGNVECGTISGSTIAGNVTAENVTGSTISGNLTCETEGGNTVTGTKNCPTPVTPPTDPAVEPMPVSTGNIADWEKDAKDGDVITPPGGTLTISSSQNLGPAKIVGNLTVSGSSTVVTLQGPVWVVGDILFDNNSKIMLDSDFGGYSTVMIADDPANRTTKGRVRVDNNANICGTSCTQTNGTYTLVLSTHDSASTDAIYVRNNTFAGIFYASSGSARMYNGVTLKEVTAYKLILEQTAVVNYETGLANAAFTSGPGASWIGKKGSWQVIAD